MNLRTPRACLKTRPVRGPGLQLWLDLAIFCRPRALTRRFGEVFKQALTLGLLLLLPVALWAQTNPPPVRLAIFPAESSTAAVADLLTAELSEKPGVVLLERAQIEKIYREQALSSANRNYVKLGQLLGAEGLLLLEPATEGANQFLTSRLVATKPGVVIDAVRVPWRVAMSPDWAKLRAVRIAALLPKLGVGAKEALPLSILNLRSAVPSREAERLEQQLTTLTIEHLSRQRELFVLERRQMGLLGAEKELNGLGESPFWNGSYLLEGVLDRDGYSQDRVTANARLTPPGGAPIEIAIAGPRGDLGALAGQLSAKILAALGRSTVAEGWQTEAEAQRFYEEAVWALKWGMFKEAQSAADSAWALGRHDSASAILRVKAYAADGQPDQLNELYGLGLYKNETDTPDDMKAFIAGKIREHNGKFIFIHESNVVQYASLLRPPDATKFRQATHALELYEAQLRNLETNSPATRKEWCQQGSQLLELAGHWLRDYYLAVPVSAELHDELELTRAIASDIAVRLRALPEANVESYWNAVGAFGVFWCETPEQGVKLYRELVSARQFAVIRKHASGCQPFCWKVLLPTLADWTGHDDSLEQQLWQKFVADLCASPDMEVRVNGYFLVCAQTQSPVEFESAFQQMHFYETFGMRDDVSNLLSEKLEKGSPHLWVEPVRRYRATLDRVAGRQLQATEFKPRASAKPVPPPPLIPTNALAITRYWSGSLPKSLRLTNYPDDQSDGPGPGTILSCCYREGYLWVEANFEWGKVTPGAWTAVRQQVLFRLDLKTFNSEVIGVPREWTDAIGLFEVFRDQLYLSTQRGLKRYSLKSKKWEDLPVPWDGHARIMAFNGRIFLSNASSLMELSPEGRSTTVLISTRRVPPQNVMDRLGDLFEKADKFPQTLDWTDNFGRTFSPVIPGRDGTIMSFVKGTCYVLPDGASDWLASAQIPASTQVNCTYSTNGILILAKPNNTEAAKTRWYQPGREVFLLPAGSTNATRVFAAAPNPNGLDLKQYNLSPDARPARWLSPAGAEATEARLCLDGDSVWALCGTFPDKTPQLLHFSPGKQEPVIYPLRFQPPPGLSQRDWNRGWGRNCEQLEFTPQGLVVAWDGINGLWLIPTADLQRNGQPQLSNSQR